MQSLRPGLSNSFTSPTTRVKQHNDCKVMGISKVASVARDDHHNPLEGVWLVGVSLTSSGPPDLLITDGTEYPALNTHSFAHLLHQVRGFCGGSDRAAFSHTSV